jgi:hypothetical protein
MNNSKVLTLIILTLIFSGCSKENNKQKDWAEIRSNAVSLATETVIAQAQLQDSQSAVAEILKQASREEISDYVLRGALKDTDLSEISEQSGKAINNISEAKERLDELFVLDLVSPEFQEKFIRLQTLIKNNHSFCLSFDDGEISSYSVNKWIADTKESQELVESLDSYLKKLMSDVKKNN